MVDEIVQDLGMVIISMSINLFMRFFSPAPKVKFASFYGDRVISSKFKFIEYGSIKEDDKVCYFLRREKDGFRSR